MRVVSLDPAVTELVFALGAGSLLVGRSDEADYPDAARSIPSVGEANAQTVSIFEPDIVLEGFIAHESVGGSRWRFVPDDLKSLLDDIRSLGVRLGKEIETDIVVHDIHTAIDHVYAKCARFRRVRVAIDQERGTVPPGLLCDLVRVAGGEPFSGITDVDALRAFNPQFIITIGSDEFVQLAESRLAELEAVKNERVFALDEWMVRPGPRIGEGLRQLAKILHGVEVSKE
jgi:iron complex transport system substrate-binding protein